MPPDDTVAAERRVDLASLFCMIGRHGPAALLAVVATSLVLAAVIIYRTVRGRRRKAAAADGDGGTGASAEESRNSAESTDVSDEGSSDVKEKKDVIPSDFIIRHRPAAAVAAAQKKPPPCSPLNPDIQAPEHRQPPSDDTGEMKVVSNSYEVTEPCAEEAKRGQPSDTSAVAEMEVGHAVDCHQGAAGGMSKDVVEELRDNGCCLKEPELINDENHMEGEKVLKAEWQEEEDLTTGRDVCSFNNHMETSRESYSEEPVTHFEDVPAPSVCHGKSEDENPDGIDCTSYSTNNHLSPEEDNKNDGEMVERELADDRLITQEAEISSSTVEQVPKLTSTHQDQGDQVTDKAMPPVQGSVWDEDDGLQGEAIDEVVDEDHLSTHTAVECGTRSPQLNKREEEIEQKQESCLACSQEDGVLCDDADQVNEKTLTTDNNSQECDALSAPLPCLSVPVKVDVHDDGLSGITTDAEAQTSGIADVPELPAGCQPLVEDKTASSLDEDTDSTVLGPQIPSHEKEVLPESTRNGSTEECDDQVLDPHVRLCYKDQKSSQMINNEDFDLVAIAPYPDTASVIVEEICCHSPSACEDQQNDSMESDEVGVSSATGTVHCNQARLSAPLMSEDLSPPDMSSVSQDQQRNLLENNEVLSEVTSRAAPVMSKDISPPMCQICMPSFEQCERRGSDMSSPCVGEESGISSLAVSPDVQDAGNEFGVAIRNMAIDCDLQSVGQTEAQHSLFADDVASSVTNEDTAGMGFGPYPSLCFQIPHGGHTDWNTFETFVTNEDMFGHEIEEGYHRVMDQFTAQISASVTRFTDDLTIQTDMKAVIEVVEIKEERAGGSVKQKEDTKAEEKEEEYERTEISIMEATMDYNEWITESNYHVLPWLSFSARSFDQDPTKTNQLPSEICQDIPPSTEVKQTSTLSLVDENSENSKKVVAVQPMPQNVNVTFQVHYFTQSPHQTVAVTGNQQELGNWKGFIPLKRAKDGHWAAVISLPAESHLEWKFVLLDRGEVCRWEECGNRLLDTGYGDDLLVHKWWGLL